MKHIAYFVALLFITQRSLCQRTTSSVNQSLQPASISIIKFDSTLNCYVEVSSISLGTFSFQVQIDNVSCEQTINMKGRTITPFFNLADSSVIAEKNVTLSEAHITVVNSQIRLNVKQQI